MSHGHPIRVAAKKSGISPHLIRMWERRYSAITPKRTETGRRLYTDEDIERLILLRRATLEGETISQVAKLNREQLRSLISKPEPKQNTEIDYKSSLSLDQHLNLCFQSMKDLDAIGLETRLLRASLSLDQRSFLERLLHPLLELTGEKWSDGRLKVDHEHLASAVIRSLLGTMYISNTSSGNDPLLISTTPAGQHHEFGALMASITAATSGWRTLYLGSSLPAEDIVDAAENRNANAIALSIVYPADDSNLFSELHKIYQMTKGKYSIIVGGRSAIAYDQILSEIGAIRVGSLNDFRRELDNLKAKLNPASLLMDSKK